MYSTKSRSSGHSDTNLVALPAKNVLLSAARQLLISLYDENGGKMFAFSDSNGVSQSQSVDPDHSQTATLFEKLEGAIKMETECIPNTAQDKSGD